MVNPRKMEIGRRAGAVIMDMLKRGIRPLDVLTREAFENAIAGVAATAGSTNAVLALAGVGAGSGC